MRLGIRHHQQEKSLSCGVAALRIVMNYFGDKVSEEDLYRKNYMHSFGMYLTDLGIIALERGYSVIVYSLHLPLLSPLDLPMGTVVTRNVLEKIPSRASDKGTLDSWRRYTEKGGRLIWDVPRISILEESINNKIPCLINVNTSALGNYWRHWNNGHYLIVEGVTKESIEVQDPGKDEVNGEYSIQKDLLLPSLAINSRISSGHLMVISK